MRTLSILYLLTLLTLGLVEGRNENLHRIEATLGPEWLHEKRTKKGGTKQQGDLVGVHGTITRIKRYGFYTALDGAFLEGMLRGKSPAFSSLHSRAKMGYIEGRLGYTFQEKKNLLLSFTPLIGIGYFYDRNHFTSRAPISLKTKIDYGYALAGFLSTLQLSEKSRLAFLFKVKIPYEPRSHVSNDPDNPSVKQRTSERLHYSFEMPITFKMTYSPSLYLFLDPCLEFRTYGSHPNYPFDFFRTTYTTWGLTMGIQYCY